MDNTIIQQGSFTADGNAKYIVLRSDVDWISVLNLTEAAATTQDHGFRYYWQRVMTQGRGFVEYHPAADHTMAIDQIAADAGFTLIDTSDTAPGANRAITATGNGVAPQIDAANTGGLAAGSIVRLNNVTGAAGASVASLCGWDFEITNINPGVSFDMAYNMANAPGLAGTAGFYRHIPYDPIFYPRFRYIVNITAADPAVITTSVQHGYTVGQKFRVNLPDANFGMTEINKLEATVTAVTASTITTDIDSTGFAAFAFALPADVPFTMPTVNPIGIDTGTALLGAVDLLADATRNTAYIGIRLHPGVLSPAGSNNDVIKWVACKSFSNLVED